MASPRSKPLFFKDRGKWRAWLSRNHLRVKEVWLGYFKKGSGKRSVTHAEAVEEALCFGWIDSQIKSLNEESYIQRYTPRRPGSIWSKINKDAAIRLMAQGQMTKAGLRAVEEAKGNGQWARAYTSKRRMRVPADLRKALRKDRKVERAFDSLTNSHRTRYISWIEDAKRAETRKARITKVVEMVRKDHGAKGGRGRGR